jgi:magnesium transporter
VLIGIVTVDDVMDVAEEEATEDFHRSAAMEPLAGSYWETSARFLYRARVGWLAMLVVVNLLSSGVIAAFEETLTAVVALAFFIPLIIDTGGNAGSQAATLMVRAISTRDVRLRDWSRVLGKEMLVGVGLGVTLGALGALLGLWRGGPEIGIIVFLTMVSMMVATNMIGMILPFVLTALGRDPATASGPLITSIADAVGLVIYFSYAVLVLGEVA